jgi:hypothetical protein
LVRALFLHQAVVKTRRHLLAVEVVAYKELLELNFVQADRLAG